MKILIVSLLRIGDIVMTAPVLRGLREKHPQARIEVLMNSQFASVTELLPYIDRFRFFDRESLQKGLGEAQVPLFQSFSRLEKLIDELNGESYDTIYNLTQNRLSGWLTSLIDAKEKIGLSLDPSGLGSFNSSWFKYLNQQIDSESSEFYHYNDVFRSALTLPEVNLSHLTTRSLVETPDGKTEAANAVASLPRPDGAVIAVQVFSSDRKKEWGLASWQRALSAFAKAQSDVQILLLGAPSERDRLEFLSAALTNEGVVNQLAIVSFAGAFSLLRRSRLLVTADTSIKHLAAAAKTPIIELSLGSSDVHRTGAYQHGALILTSREVCAPCVHSNPCHRASHACAESLPSDLVSLVMNEVYNGREFQLGHLAEAYKRDADILRVDLRTLGAFTAYSVNPVYTEKSAAKWISRTVKRVWLESQTPGRDDQRGTETARLAAFLRARYPHVADFQWQQLFTEIEEQGSWIAGRVNGLKTELQYLKGAFNDPRKMSDFVKSLVGLRERLRKSVPYASVRESLEEIVEDDVSPTFTRIRRITSVIGEIDNRTDLTVRLARALRTHFDSQQVQFRGVEPA